MVFQIQPRINLNMLNNVTNFAAVCVHIMSKLFRAKMETKYRTHWLTSKLLKNVRVAYIELTDVPN